VDKFDFDHWLQSSSGSEASLSTRRDTQRLAAAIAAVVRAGDLLLLSGELAAGKTFLARAVLRKLGVDAPRITSPTFALVQEYTSPRLPVLHADLYRLLDHPNVAAEVANLGLLEARLRGALVIAEWADTLIAELGGTPYHCVRMQQQGAKRFVSYQFVPRTTEAVCKPA
jgi:tRNA threonylcarbamoyladenosine biosynthesis protein TsaE